MCNLELLKELEEKHCKYCCGFVEGVACKYELSIDKEKEDIYSLMYKRKDVCSLDKEPTHIRKQIYKGLESEGTLFSKLPSSREYREYKMNRRRKSKLFSL